MDRLIGYELLPWEDFSAAEHNDALIQQGVKDIKDAGYTAFEALAGTTLTHDYARRFLEFSEWTDTPNVRSDTYLFQRISSFLRAARDNGLVMTSLFCEGEYANPIIAEAEFDQAIVVSSLIRAGGGHHLLVDGGPRRREPMHSEDIVELARALERVGRATAEIGVELCFHPHIDTCIETIDEVERFFNEADDAYVLMALDTAHITAGGGDPVKVLRDSGDRVRYVHLKDIDMSQSENPTFAGPARYAAFRDLGEGSVDFPGFWNALGERGFVGPVIVEVDASPDPAKSARVSRSYLKEALGC